MGERCGCRGTRRCTRLGELVGSAAFQRDAERANTRPPVLHAHDQWGNRVDEVEYDDAYHRIIAAAVGAGAHTSAWAQPGPVRTSIAPRRSSCSRRSSRARVPGVDDARGGAGARAGGIRAARRVDAAPALARVRPACRGARRLGDAAKSLGARRHGDDREAGRVRRAREHDARRADRASTTPGVASSGSPGTSGSAARR